MIVALYFSKCMNTKPHGQVLLEKFSFTLKVGKFKLVPGYI